MSEKLNPIKWSDFKETLLTKEEREEIDMEIEIIGQLYLTRKEEGYTQKQLEELSGVKQSLITRVEHGKSNPPLRTFLKILRAMGKTISIVPIHSNKHA